MTPRQFLIAAGASGAIGVALGAFGAHALADAVTPERLETWRTATLYHLVHALALAVVAVAMRNGWPVQTAGRFFLAGLVLFCGSLYALVLLDAGVLGAIAPLGGLAFIAGWSVLGWVAWREG